ncbi:MAG: NAD(P)H-binding protein [candidate division Zixibacteria bacterium]|nr:NAD(P)H-binding protein [candidate division Zixibacteria bacterium]
MSHKVLVVGGTGMLGLPVARQLKADGFEVTVMSSNVDRAQAMFSGEFRLTTGDVTNIESLKDAIDGQDFVFVNLNASLDPDLYRRLEIDGTANVARVCREMGVRRVGNISGASSRGKEEGIIYLDAKVKAERAIIESGVPYSIMRPSWFFESLPSFIQRGRAAVLGHQPGKFAWLAASDYARQVSRAFQTEAAANRCFYNLGPEKMTMMAALTKFCRRHYPELEPQEVSFKMAGAMAMLPGMKLLKRVIPFFEYFSTRTEEVDGSDADRILGPNTTTIDMWLEQYRPPA